MKSIYTCLIIKLLLIISINSYNQCLCESAYSLKTDELFESSSPIKSLSETSIEYNDLDNIIGVFYDLDSSISTYKGRYNKIVKLHYDRYGRIINAKMNNNSPFRELIFTYNIDYNDKGDTLQINKQEYSRYYTDQEFDKYGQILVSYKDNRKVSAITTMPNNYVFETKYLYDESGRLIQEKIADLKYHYYYDNNIKDSVVKLDKNYDGYYISIIEKHEINEHNMIKRLKCYNSSNGLDNYYDLDYNENNKLISITENHLVYDSNYHCIDTSKVIIEKLISDNGKLFKKLSTKDFNILDSVSNDTAYHIFYEFENENMQLPVTYYYRIYDTISRKMEWRKIGKIDIKRIFDDNNNLTEFHYLSSYYLPYDSMFSDYKTIQYSHYKYDTLNRLTHIYTVSDDNTIYEDFYYYRPSPAATNISMVSDNVIIITFNRYLKPEEDLFNLINITPTNLVDGLNELKIISATVDPNNSQQIIIVFNRSLISGEKYSITSNTELETYDNKKVKLNFEAVGYKSSVVVNELTQSKLSLSQSNDIIVLSSPIAIKQVEVLSASGSKIASLAVKESNTASVNTSGMTAGVYMLAIMFLDGNSETVKVVIK